MPESLPPLLAGEVRRVDLVAEERGAVRFTLVGGDPESFRVEGASADGLRKATMVRPGDSGAVIETGGCLPGPWVFQLTALRGDGTTVREERRIEVIGSQTLEVTLEVE